MQNKSKVYTHILAASAALLLVAGCSSSDSDSDTSSDAASSSLPAPTEPAPTEPAPTEPAPTEPTTTPASGTSCDAATLAAALDTTADKIERFECKDGYAGVDYAMGAEGIEGTVILSSDDDVWSKVNKSVCTNNDFPSSLKKDYCDVS